MCAHPPPHPPHTLQHVYDGDLCEAYPTLPMARQKDLAKDLTDRTVNDVLKKLEEVRITHSL